MKRAHRLRAALAGLLAAGALLSPLAGCTEPTEPAAPFERLGRRAARKVVPRAGPDARVVAARRWGLAAPLEPAPRPPAVRPALPYVVDRVPLHGAKVVFLTFDDGPGTDPGFPRMVRDLKLPVALFLTDSVAAPGYDRVEPLRALGAGESGISATRLTARLLDEVQAQGFAVGRLEDYL
ncbi:hypothetical protein [Streptomyces sp. WM6378]|uniref:hypothetical protein n=1 Tax=Streptomyces sp. WM6378 TaxID=1415557 RepID=UPI0006AF9AA9|nr:hypothetical protein [Streptomyces sp. WM6378]